MGWYDSKRKSLDIDSSNVSTNGALTAKAISDAFLGVAKVIDDKRKTDLLEEKAKLENEKTQIDLSKAYQDTEQKAIDDTYLNYVDSNTGKFNQEQLNKDNVGLPLNQVSLDAKLKQKQLENAYNLDLEKVDAKAQEEISNEIAKEMVKYKTKEEFDKNVNSDLIRYANGKTMVAVDKFYNDSALQEAKINKANSDLVNQTKLSKLEIQLEKEKLKNETGKPKEVKAADDSLIGKNIATYFGGTYNPVTGEITGLDKESAKVVTQYQALASKYYKENKDITHNEAAALALSDYEKSINEPKPTPKPTNDPFGWLNK